MGLEYGTKKSAWWEMLLGAGLAIVGIVFLLVLVVATFVWISVHSLRNRYHRYRFERHCHRDSPGEVRQTKSNVAPDEAGTAGSVLCEREPNSEELKVIRCLLDRLQLQSLRLQDTELYYSTLHVASIRVWFGELKVVWLDLEFSEMLLERLRSDLRAPAGYQMEYSYEELALRRLQG